jgi:tetratricopeptide (TPR) repeat protein
MDAVVDYLDWWGTPNERMTAYYLRGSVYRDQDNAPMALRYYRDAVSYADTTASDCDYRRLSRIYGQIADLFNRQRAPRLEIEAERKAVEYAWRAKDTLSAIIFYQLLGNPYHMLNMMDSCLYYNYQAIEMYNKYGYTEYASGNLAFLIDIHLRRNEYHEAKVCMEEFEKNLDEDYYINHSGYFRYWGLYYLGINKLDSAELYFRRVIDNRPNNIPESTLKGMMQIYQQLGIGDSIAKYAELYCQYNDSASFQHSADELTRTQALYNYEEHERIAAKKTAEAERYKIIIAISLVTFCLLAYACFRYIRKQQRRKKAELMAANTEYLSLLGQYKKLQDDMLLSQRSIDEFRDGKEREIQQLLQKLALYQEVPQICKHWDAEQAMLQSPIVSHLHHLASQVVAPTHSQWQELRSFAEEHLSAFYQYINRRDLGLTNQEILISILVRFQFIPSEQAALLDVSKQRITNLRSSINQKLFGTKGSKNLEENITTLSTKIL